MAAVAKPAKRRTRVAVKRPKRTTAAARRAFLDELAQSANVTAAAKRGRMTTSAFYQHRRADAEFRAQWHAALCEGYARLETELLAEALAAPDAEASDAVVKARLYKQRLALALLTAHRASVRGERNVGAVQVADDTKGAKARLIQKFADMEARRAEAEAEGRKEGQA